MQRFCSHPTADAVRKTIQQWRKYGTNLPKDDTYPEASTFYIYLFNFRTLCVVVDAMQHIQDFTGGRVRICEFALRPTLRPLYDKAFPKYFNTDVALALGEEETDTEGYEN